MKMTIDQYPAHQALQDDVDRFPNLWHATSIDTGGQGNINDIIHVSYKDLLAEFNQLRQQVDDLVGSLKTAHMLTAGGARAVIELALTDYKQRQQKDD